MRTLRHNIALTIQSLQIRCFVCVFSMRNHTSTSCLTTALLAWPGLSRHLCFFPSVPKIYTFRRSHWRDLLVRNGGMYVLHKKGNVIFNVWKIWTEKDRNDAKVRLIWSLWSYEHEQQKLREKIAPQQANSSSTIFHEYFFNICL